MKWEHDRNHFVLSQWVDAFQTIINFWIFIKYFTISNVFILWVHNNIKSLFMTYITFYINSKSSIEVILMLIEEHKNNFYIILIKSNVYFNIFNKFKWCWFYKTHFLVLLKNTNKTNNTFFSLFYNTNFCQHKNFVFFIKQCFI